MSPLRTQVFPDRRRLEAASAEAPAELEASPEFESDADSRPSALARHATKSVEGDRDADLARHATERAGEDAKEDAKLDPKLDANNAAKDNVVNIGVPTTGKNVKRNVKKTEKKNSEKNSAKNAKRNLQAVAESQAAYEVRTRVITNAYEVRTRYIILDYCGNFGSELEYILFRRTNTFRSTNVFQFNFPQ
jgi:hypothetical protein